MFRGGNLLFFDHCIIELTWANAWWALLHHLVYICLYVTWQKFTRKKNCILETIIPWSLKLHCNIEHAKVHSKFFSSSTEIFQSNSFCSSGQWGHIATLPPLAAKLESLYGETFLHNWSEGDEPPGKLRLQTLAGVRRGRSRIVH